MRFYRTDMPSVTRWPNAKGVEESKMDKRQYKVMNDTAATLGSTHRRPARMCMLDLLHHPDKGNSSKQPNSITSAGSNLGIAAWKALFAPPIHN